METILRSIPKSNLKCYSYDLGNYEHKIGSGKLRFHIAFRSCSIKSYIVVLKMKFVPSFGRQKLY